MTKINHLREIRQVYGYSIFTEDHSLQLDEYLSPTAFMNIIDRLDIIRGLNLTINFKGIHPNRIKQLSRLGSKYEPHSFRRFGESKRYAMLAAYLHDLSQNLIDFAIEILAYIYP